MGDGKNGWGWGGGYFKGAGFLTPVWRPGFLPSIKGAAFFLSRYTFTKSVKNYIFTSILEVVGHFIFQVYVTNILGHRTNVLCFWSYLDTFYTSFYVTYQTQDINFREVNF